MSKKYLLPPLREKNEINSESCWKEYEEPYRFLINNMILQNESTKSIFEGGSNAVPHVFEQMLLFHDAFLDEKNKEHDRAVMEWRAILILLALQRIQNIDISFQKVELREDSKNSFIKAAIMFLPEDKPVFHQTTWDFLYVICLKNKPIAFVSPVTIVCPAKQFMKKIALGMDRPLIRLERVNGKDKMFLDVEDERLIYKNISVWFDVLNSKLTYATGESVIREKARKVKEELEKYKGECDEHVVGEQEIKFEEHIYPVMNQNVRKEYDFLNFCCDFVVKNKKLRFLVKRYKEDIFESTLAVLVKDEMPDAMFKTENIMSLEKVFPNTLYLNDKSVIFLEKQGGERLAACVLLPFKEVFIRELIEQKVMAEEFFEKFSAVYDENCEQIRISFRISEFPYTFEKIYTKENYKYMYAEEVPVINFWPRTCLRTSEWKIYYTYIENYKSVKVSVPMNTGSVEYGKMTDKGSKPLFQLVRTETYPAYLFLGNSTVGGYLPIKTELRGVKSADGVLEVFIDIGHTTTHINMLKKVSGNEYEQIPFCIPSSLRIAAGKEENNVAVNFIADNTVDDKKGVSYIKNMLHSFRNYAANEKHQDGLRPFSAGQILFEPSAYCVADKDMQVSFFNFEYDQNNQAERENIHTFIEQLLLYVAYQAVQIDASYLKIHFLHNVEKNHAKYGEIFGLWENVLRGVKAWTGIKSTYGIEIDSLEEYQALAYNTYYNAAKISGLHEKEVYAGIDIGWKKTLMACFKSIDTGKSENPKFYHTEIKYAGSNISLMKANIISSPVFFSVYSHLLSIFLTGSPDYKEHREYGKILELFEEYCKGSDTQYDSFYQGVFDLMAMLIEDVDNQRIDIYYNMPEFRKFIGMLTYNIYLLFLNIGCLLGEVDVIKETEKITVYLSGNGAKFIQWISNLQHVEKIDDNNCQNVLILTMQDSILDIIKEGIKLTSVQEKNPKQISMVLLTEPKEQLIKGYMFKEGFGQDGKKEEDDKKNISIQNFEYSELKNTFKDGNDRKKFELIEKTICKEIFEEENVEEDVGEEGKSGNGAQTQEDENYKLGIDELISEKSRRVCREIIKKIQKMQSK